MPNNKCIIGLAGKAGAGKDTVATMLEYMFKKRGKSNFAEWHRLELTKSHDTSHTMHFADNLKLVCSVVFNIPVELFNDREHKDKLLYCFAQRRFLKEKEVTNDYREITIDHLSCRTLEDARSACLNNNYIPLIRLRTLLQYVGTEIFRKQIDNKIWVNSCIYNAHSITDVSNYCIISDVRFKEEAEAVMGSSLYGGLIMINRDGLESSNHASENMDFICPFTIDNNGTKMQLFYQVFNLFTDKLLPLYKHKI